MARSSDADDEDALRLIADGRYKMGRKIEAGAYGEVFRGKNVRTGEKLAIKRELSKGSKEYLTSEALFLAELAADVAVPVVHWHGFSHGANFLVMEYLGLSVGDLFQSCSCQFGLKTVLMLADQMITRLEEVHRHGIVHRDVKPDNFIMGRGRRAIDLYIIDFGLAKKFRDAETNLHIPFQTHLRLTGTPRFASVAAFDSEQSRRDDLESLGYTLVFLLRGSLPWQGSQRKKVGSSNSAEDLEEVRDMKANLSLPDLCRGCPAEFVDFLAYCKKLDFQATPDYDHLRHMFRDLMSRNEFDYDAVFQWMSAGSLDSATSGSEDDSDGCAC